MTQQARLGAISLCLALTWSTTASAAPVASDADINKAMNVLPADTRKSLNLDASDGGKSGAKQNDSTGIIPQTSLRCRQLRADIDRAQYAAPEAPRDVYPEGPRRDGKSSQLSASSLPGLQVNSGNSARGRPSGNIEYGGRARLEAQFQRECQ